MGAVKTIVIVGLARHGKTTSAEELLLLIEGAQIDTFSAPLKAMLKAGLGLRASQFESEKTVKDDLYGCTPRYLMQTLGTEWGRRMVGRDVWAMSLLRRIFGKDATTLIADTRFLSEVAKMRQKTECFVIRVNDERKRDTRRIMRVHRWLCERWRHEMPWKSDGLYPIHYWITRLIAYFAGVHQSEAEVDLIQADMEIDNSGTMEELKDKLENFAAFYCRIWEGKKSPWRRQVTCT